ncbi:hypothetical protein [Hymenobacter sp.]|uniref:hypothetical protein n=1 Tax=Hymenobacter sp. TaxID=1898978 RepID=UPI00286AB7E7|nr:hypothetical protein [Hymenobacter sp.]
MNANPTLALAALSALLLATPAAQAQDSPYGTSAYGGGWATSLDVSTSISNDIINSEMAKRNAGIKTTGTGAKTKSTAAAPVKVPASRLTYASTAALKQQTVQGYAARLRASDPTTAQAITTTFAPGKADYALAYRTITQSAGLGENDAAATLANLLLTGYRIVHNLTDVQAISPAAAQSLRAKAAGHLAANANLAKPGVMARFSEEMKLRTVVLYAGWQNETKRNALPVYQSEVASTFKTQFGLDFRALQLTDRGFAKK